MAPFKFKPDHIPIYWQAAAACVGTVVYLASAIPQTLGLNRYRFDGKLYRRLFIFIIHFPIENFFKSIMMEKRKRLVMN